jgi:DNA mismatch repair protein MutS
MQSEPSNSFLPPGTKLTPMLQQWLEAKRRAKDAILLFRMGDFYELFADDAVKAAPILELTLTSRDKDKGDASVPMAGFPHHSAPAYIAKLVGEGFKVALCDQMEDPKQAKGIVKREVTRIVTPGTVLDDDGLKANANNYLVGVVAVKGRYGLAALDWSTGDFIATATEREDGILDEVGKLAPAELLLGDFELPDAFVKRLEQAASLNRACRVERMPLPGKNHSGLKALGTLDDWFLQSQNEVAIAAAELLLAYVADTQGGVAKHVLSPRPYSIDAQLMIDATSRVHLDLIGPPHEIKKPGTLLSVIDKTRTAMGSRQLVRWILAPSTSLEVIGERHAAVGALIEEPGVRKGVREALKHVYDFERLTAKASSGRVNPRELWHLQNSLAKLPELFQILHHSEHANLRNILREPDLLGDLHDTLACALAFEPPLTLKEGGIFKTGYDPLLDELVELSSGGRDQIASIEQREREVTGIASLKVKYTRVFGYYIEITKTHLAKVPEHYRRKQTVAGGERYVTEDLMRLEELVATAEVRRLHRESELFEALRESVVLHAAGLLQTASIVARLDALCSFAELADQRRYVRPTMLEAKAERIEITQGRHPIVEVISEQRGQPFVPNDMELVGESRQVLLITGPNMAGKSTIMRQVALIQLLAQAGSFVPAKSATLSICDRIFTRVGAADDLKQGRSTFMVEMSETAHILKHASRHSLVLLDEIGRGTSTFDGLSLAWAVAEHLHNHIGARTLFATHYHELVELSDTLPRVRNVQVAVREVNDSIAFLYTLAEGAAEQSYGIHVAKLAGLPPSVLRRAQEVLNGLEEKRHHNPTPKPQLDLFCAPVFNEGEVRKLLDVIKCIDVNQTTPIEALNQLVALKHLGENI